MEDELGDIPVGDKSWLRNVSCSEHFDDVTAIVESEMDTSSDEEYAMGPYRAKLRSLSRQSSHRTLSEAESTIMDAIQTRIQYNELEIIEDSAFEDAFTSATDTDTGGRYGGPYASSPSIKKPSFTPFNFEPQVAENSLRQHSFQEHSVSKHSAPENSGREFYIAETSVPDRAVRKQSEEGINVEELSFEEIRAKKYEFLGVKKVEMKDKKVYSLMTFAKLKKVTGTTNVNCSVR